MRSVKVFKLMLRTMLSLIFKNSTTVQFTTGLLISLNGNQNKIENVYYLDYF